MTPFPLPSAREDEPRCYECGEHPSECRCSPKRIAMRALAPLTDLFERIRVEANRPRPRFVPNTDELRDGIPCDGDEAR